MDLPKQPLGNFALEPILEGGCFGHRMARAGGRPYAGGAGTWQGEGITKALGVVLRGWRQGEPVSGRLGWCESDSTESTR